jgi:hypothetical protein
MMKKLTLAMVSAAALASAGCGGDGTMMGPGGPDGRPMGTAAFLSIRPEGGAVGVSVGAAIELQWGAAMAAGMEQYVDLHRGDLSGPVVPMSCAWSGDRTTLVCTPSSPLQPGTQYVVHVGGGMVDSNGELIDMDEHSPAFGGEWIQGGMIGVGHAGMPWSMMGGGWQHGNGVYGMAFAFTTN